MEVLNIEKLTPLGAELKRLMSADGSEIQTVPHLAQALEIPEFDAWGLFDGSTEVNDVMAEKLIALFKVDPSLAAYWRTRLPVWSDAWDKEEDLEPLLLGEHLNKRLIAALAGMCYERLSLGCEMSPESFFDETALNLLRDIGVVVQLDETEYEFTPGFDPELGEWT